MASTGLLGLFLKLPSLQHFLLDLAQDIAHRRSLLVVLPPWMSPDDVWEALQGKLWKGEIFSKRVPLTALNQERSPAAELAEALGLKWSDSTVPRTPENLISMPGLPELVYLDESAQVPPDIRAKWVKFMVRWADLSHSCFDLGNRPAALCMIMQGSDVPLPLPENGMYFSVRWLWGVPSALEMHLLCRQGSEPSLGTQETCLDQWREHLLPSLAGNDVLLAQYLWDKLTKNSAELTTVLLKFAEERGWTKDKLLEWGTGKLPESFGGEYDNLPAGPPGEYIPLCMHGVLCQTPEYGLELSAPALTVQGRNEELRHRIWRGQALLLLPLLDKIRLHVLDLVSRNQDDFSNVRGNGAGSAGNQAASLEWGELEDKVRGLAKCRRERSWLPLISLARSMRNRLAHYHPVTFSQFVSLMKEFKKLVG